jgi:hypothetical protein
MDALHAKADWECVGDRWFRKTQLYTAIFDEDLDLGNYIVAGAPYGGALGTFSIWLQGKSSVSLQCDDMHPREAVSGAC